MRIPLLLLVPCVSFVLLDRGAAQTPQQLQFWQEATAKKSLSEIAKLMSDTAKPAWPNAPSVFAAKGLPPEKRLSSEAAIALVKAIHEKQRREFKASAPVSNAEVRTYSTLASALEKAGGYSNILLADSFRRLTILRASEALVRGARPSE